VPAQILAVAGMIAAILTGYPQVMLAAGRPRPLMVFNCCVLVAYAVGVYFTAELGLVAVAIAVVVIHVAILAAVYLILFRSVLGLPIGRLVTDLAPAVAGSALVLAVGFPLADLLRQTDLAAPLIVLLAGVAGVAVQALSLRALFPHVWADISGLLRRLLPNRLPLGRPVISSSPS